MEDEQPNVDQPAAAEEAPAEEPAAAVDAMEEEQPPAEGEEPAAADMEGMEGMDGMEGEMEGVADGDAAPDGDMDAMEGMDGMAGEGEGMGEGMEGEPGEGMDAMDMEGEADGDGEEGKDDQAEAQVPIKDYTADPRIQWMLKHLDNIMNYKADDPAMAPTNERLQQFAFFLDKEDYNKFFVWVDFETMELRWDFYSAPKFYGRDESVKKEDFQVCFFIKRVPTEAVCLETIGTQLICGLADGDPLDDLLNIMNNDYAPKLLGENDWPEGVKKEFVANLHYFMAYITETSYVAKGKTYLYIPNEDLTDVDTAIKDKDLLQRLESIVIYWTRQIKELVSNQDSQTSHDNSSPLDEIEHWKKRTNNLDVLTKRLKDPKLLKIIDVLQKVSSSYLQNFQDLQTKIQDGYDEASNNLKFLNTLEEPCKKIDKAQPKDIPKLLPEVLNNVRVIWELSKFYNTDDRMKGLLTKISNQINQRCRQKINKEEMLGDDVEKCMDDLDESIACCQQWKEICTRVQYMIKTYSQAQKTRPWVLLEDDTIFAENEAFIQRCRDLKEICEGQLQFAQRGASCVMPVFGGTRGQEWKNNLQDLKKMFDKYLDGIKNLEYDILDVKITKWHDDYGQNFKDQIKNIEVIYTTIIQMTFRTVSTVEDAVEMLENFQQLAKRPTIIDYVQKKGAAEVYRLFADEIKEVENIFESHTGNKKRPPMPVSWSHYGGVAIWVHSLIVRLDKAKESIDGLYFIPNDGTQTYKADSIEQYEKLKHGLDQYIIKTLFEDWNKNLDDLKNLSEVESSLEVSILQKSTEESLKNEPQVLQKNALFGKQRKEGLLSSNFNTKLLKNLIEVQYWDKVQALYSLQIPSSLTSQNQKRDRLRQLRESVMLVVRDYNNIMLLIDKNEKKLFNEHLAILDKQIKPGIDKFTWSINADSFVLLCRKECHGVFQKIKMYQEKYGLIEDEFKKISEAKVTDIKKILYQLRGFMDLQSKEMKNKASSFSNSFEIIRQLLMDTYFELFLKRGKKIQDEWLYTMHGLDRKLEKALISSVKNTLLDFQHHIKGDHQEIVPIFKIFTILDSTKDDWKTMHEPSHAVLKQEITQFMRDVVKVTECIPRVEGIFRKDRQVIIDNMRVEQDKAEAGGGGGGGQFGGNRNTDINYQNMTEEEKSKAWDERWALKQQNYGDHEYYDKCTQSKDIKGISAQISTVVDNIQQKMDEDCKLWQLSPEIRHLQSLRTDRGINRFLKVSIDSSDNDSVAKYKQGIENLKEIVDDVRLKLSQKNEQFIVLDSSKMKNDLVDHGNAFIAQIFTHLVDASKKDLRQFLDELRDTVEELKRPCQNRAELRHNREKYKEVKTRYPQLQARIEPIKKKFEFIMDDNYSDIGIVELTEDDKNSLLKIDDDWGAFQRGMVEANSIIQKCYSEFKSVMEDTIDEFKREVGENLDNFKKNAPWTVVKTADSDEQNKKANEAIAHFSNECKALREREEDMLFGLEIFEIEPSNYFDLNKVERENASLSKIWGYKQEWDGQWTIWKDINFYDLDLEDMDETACIMVNKVQNLEKEERKWKVTEFLVDKLRTFRDTLPLITDLRDESMRERHWKELRIEVKEDFEETDPGFTLEKCFDLQLINHIEKISDLTLNAKKQLKIEKALKEIKRMWEDSKETELEMGKTPSRSGEEGFYKITSTENIITLIEDHSQQLATMKSSPYYKQFDDKIDMWENNINRITETLDLLMQVQDNWMYLESIFKGQPDLAKQLPQEEATFRQVDVVFKKEITRIWEIRKAYAALVEHVRDFTSTLSHLLMKLEGVQKKLQDLLASKRVQFPRFYFLPNEDLLEIIGQAKDPTPINKHIKKIFEGINEIQADSSGSKGSKVYHITEVISPEEEHVDLGQSHHVEVTNKVEDWLKTLEKNVGEALQKAFYDFARENMQPNKKIDKEKMSSIIGRTKGQILLTCASIQWTKEVKTALESKEATSGLTDPLKKLKGTYRRKLDIYTQCVERSGLHYRDRLKIIALIIMEEHNRDVIEKLHANKTVNGPMHFDWQQQLRYEMNVEEGSELMMINVRQLNATFDYGYEYQGNNGRLVITPLTDRAYMTLTNALDMRRGGAPQGPAGTGKTETVKDLGKNLAYFVVVQNCSENLDHLNVGTMLTGLSMSGCWGCFDEFNLIQLDVLSVITTYINEILMAMKRGGGNCTIDQTTYACQDTTGLFITFNPGYAGRSELPDNLAALFRPVAMMVPELFPISKILLMSEGFQKSDELAKKVVTIFQLMKDQLSKQSHYDFSMRAVKSVLTAAGRIKRESPMLQEIQIIIKAIRDMNLPKFLAEDVILFDNLFIDLFPDCEEPEVDTDQLQIAIEQSMLKRGLVLDETIVVKVMQLYEAKKTRHGNMLVGATMSGKTKCWEILMDAINRLHNEEKEEMGGAAAKQDHTDYKWAPIKIEVLNPKAVTTDELYGYFDDQNPPQWCEGVLSTTLKTMCADTHAFTRWMVLDGPVDTSWIESMNSVLDDSKLLTLSNSDRIALSSNCRLLFETEDLGVASPATVSRAGMVYLDIDELGWKPIVKSWIDTKRDLGADYVENLQDIVQRYLEKVLTAKRIICKELVKSSEAACVRNLTTLFDALSGEYKQGETSREDFLFYVERWFVFAMIWSVGVTVDESSRRELDVIVRDIEPMFPTTNTVFEYYINLEKREWAPWEEKLKPQSFVGKEFHEIYIQTVDWARNRFVTMALMDVRQQVLLVGQSGVGKTVLIEGMLREQDPLTLTFTVNFSAGTKSKGCQEFIESNYDRRAKNKFKPKNSKIKAVCFIDDLNMPRCDRYGFQPPIELLRQWIDYGYWYDKQKVVKNMIQDFQILAAMGKPGGGRMPLSNRMMSKFHLINFTVPSNSQMQRIFETIAGVKFAQFYEDIKAIIEPLAISTVSLYNQVQLEFLPTPAKSHYIFNMRDISKVFQGLYMADKNFYESKEQVVKLWGHELLRVFYDRLINDTDQALFKKLVNDQLSANFQMNFREHCMTYKTDDEENARDAIFVDFLIDDEDTKVYEEVEEYDKLRDHLLEKLDRYNTQPKIQKMDIVLFRDAIIHVSKIYRVLNLKRGHALLVGVGGSGRHSLTRLAGYLSNMNSEQLEIRKDFSLKMFRTKLKEIYELCAYNGARGGRDRLKTVFIFSDNDVIDESFLEDIQNMLNGGIVPNIYPIDDLQRVREEMRSQYKLAGQTNESPEVMNEFFFNRVKNHLHLAICMSPVGEDFRNYTRNYPALINSTTIDWFMKWPEEALIEVATKSLAKLDIDEIHKPALAELCGYSFAVAQDFRDRMEKELKRIFYVTPTNFVELNKGYAKILAAKKKEIGDQANKLRNGLSRLEEAGKEVAEMTAQSEIKRADVTRKTQECENLSSEMSKRQAAADEAQKVIVTETEKVNIEKDNVEIIAAQADAELARALPALEAANEAIDCLDKKAVSEVRAYNQPPKEIQTVMSAVMICLKRPTDWPSIKKVMTEANFMEKIKFFDKDNISDNVMSKIESYTKKDNFLPEYMKKKSVVAGALCLWVRSVEEYNKALKIVIPKRKKKEAAEALLAKLMASLQTMQDEYAELAEMLKKLQAELDQNNSEMEEHRLALEVLQQKIDRGDKLISGLADEKKRWEASLIILDEQYGQLVGDCLLSASFMSLQGPFPSDYREEITKLWMKKTKQLGIPHTHNYSFCDFLSDGAQARKWQIDGLPTDEFSTENGVFVTKGLRWALNIDPQTQANNWIKKMCGKHRSDSFVTLDMNDPKYINKLERCVRDGRSCLLQDVGETLDPSLDNLLNKSLVKVAGEICVKIGDNEIPYNNKFKLFITTRMQNPHYTPEVSTKVNVVNFNVKESGLEDQCLNIVVGLEQPQLEQTKNEVVEKIASNKKELQKQEDKILDRLRESDVNLLEDVDLSAALTQSKEISDEVKISLDQSEITMKRINDTRSTFKPVAKMASALFFVLNELSKINPMYQFSLDWYKELFAKSIKDSKDQGQQDRMVQISKMHKRYVYIQACRSLFEQHKLMLALQMTIKLKMGDGEINPDEWQFFLRGGVSMDEKKGAPIKPPGQEWIQAQAWDHLVELEKQLPHTFAGITNAVTLNAKEWKHWYCSTKPDPEVFQLPGEWETKCDDALKKMIVLRCFRPDRVNFAIKQFVVDNLKSTEFIQSKSTSISDVYEESSPSKPVIFVLTQGVDPTELLYKFAEEKGVAVSSISLGKGQSQKAIDFLKNGAKDGVWCFLSNCHLSASLLPDLEATLEQILVNKEYLDTFRLFLSAKPVVNFPISLLQKSLKMAQEPPRGIKPNMTRLYKNMGQQFTLCDREKEFRKAVYGLCWFHTILIERKKFKTLGWNIAYAFNDSDYTVCEDTVANYMGRMTKDSVPIETYEKGKKVSWTAIQYLLAAAAYGGRITDELDRRLINVYAKEIFDEELIANEKWRPKGSQGFNNYQYPADESTVKSSSDATNIFTPEYFLEQIGSQMEDFDPPEAFGQHTNAQINSQIMESLELLDDILSLQPVKAAEEGGMSQEERTLLEVARIQGKIPEQIDAAALKFKFRNDPDPLNVVLIQEIQRYNVLLEVIAKTLVSLARGIKGEEVISPALEAMMVSFNENKVPVAWKFAYFSLKPLAAWITDLGDRYAFFQQWVQMGYPFVYTISYFTYPTGFTTSLLQRFSRKSTTGNASIDRLEFDFQPDRRLAAEIMTEVREGAYIQGFYLEGAKWNADKMNLAEPDVMELHVPMPVIWFKPIIKRTKALPNMYECPCYYYPKRQGDVTKASYMMKIDLKLGPEQTSEHWIKRGTALLMSLDH